MDTKESMNDHGSEKATDVDDKDGKFSPKENKSYKLASIIRKNKHKINEFSVEKKLSSPSPEKVSLGKLSEIASAATRSSKSFDRVDLKKKIEEDKKLKKTIFYSSETCRLEDTELKGMEEVINVNKKFWEMKNDDIKGGSNEKEDGVEMLLDDLGHKRRKTGPLRQALFSLPPKDAFLHIIYPDGIRKALWNVIIVFVIIICTTTEAFYIGFGVIPTGVLFAFNVFLDIMFWIDIAITFRTAYHDEEGGLETDSRKIAYRYLTRGFAVDFISAFPIDDFAALFDPNATSRLGIIRLIRLLRLFKLFRLLKMVTVYLNDHFHPSFNKAMGLITSQFLFGHFMACALYSCVTFAEENTYTWADYYGGVRYMSLGIKYQSSLYWAFVTLATVGYGDMVPVNDVERGVLLFGVLMGSIFFGFTVGYMGEIFRNVNVRGGLYEKKLQFVKEFARSRRLPRHLAEIVIHHYRYFYKHSSVFDCAHLFDALSSENAVSLKLIQYGAIITKFKFLEKSNPLFSTRLAALMKPFCVLAGEVLFYENDIPQQLYFVQHGCIDLLASVKVHSGSGGTERSLIKVASVGCGELFGESVPLNDELYSYTARASEFTELFFVNKAEIMGLLDLWPSAKPVLERMASEFQGNLERLRSDVENEAVLSGGPLLHADILDRFKEELDTNRNNRISFSLDGSRKAKRVPSGRLISFFDLSKSTSPMIIKSVDSSVKKDGEKQGLDSAKPIPIITSADASSNFHVNNLDAASKADLVVDSDSDTEEMSSRCSVGSQHSSHQLNLGSYLNGLVPRQLSDNKRIVLGEKSRAMRESLVALKKYSAKYEKRHSRLTAAQADPWTMWQAYRIIHPEAYPKVGWDLFISVLIIYSVLFDSFVLAFDLKTEGAFAVISWIVTAFFLVDIIISFRTTRVDSYHCLLKDDKEIAYTYMRGWFAVDLISTIPFDLVVDPFLDSSGQSVGGIGLLKFFRLLRLIRLLRLAKVNSFVNRMTEKLMIAPAIATLLKLGMVLFFVCHLVACLWFAIGVSGEPNWLHTYCYDTQLADVNGTMVGIDERCAADVGISSQYEMSVYWAYVTLTTVGFGDIHPAVSSTPETVLTILVILLGAMVTAFGISSLVETLRSFNMAQRRQLDVVENMKALLWELRVSPGLSKKLVKQLSHTMEFRGSLDQSRIFETLPVHLKRRLVRELYFSYLQCLPLLREMEGRCPGIASLVLPRLRPAAYEAGEVVVSSSMCPREVTFVLFGACECIPKSSFGIDRIGKPAHPVTIGHGSYFGQDTLFHPLDELLELRVYVKATEATETVTLTLDDWVALEGVYPTAMGLFKRRLLESGRPEAEMVFTSHTDIEQTSSSVNNL